MKRFLSLFLAVIMVISLVPSMSIASYAATVDVLYYEINNGEVTITDCDTSASGELIIPDTIEGYPVTVIGEKAFWFSDDITSITIPDNVATIGESAFSYCDALTSVIIGSGVTSIGDRAFYECTSLKSITIPGNVSYLGEMAFKYCEDLVTATIGGGVTNIGDDTFRGCTSLEKVVIQDGIVSIGKFAFYSCIDLYSVTLPYTLMNVDSMAFYYCNRLSSVRYNGTLNQWASIDFNGITANPLYYAWDLYINNEIVTDIVLEPGITEIKPYVFPNIRFLESTVIPEGVTKIGAYAFYYSGINTVDIPNTVTEIGECAFCGCACLTSVTISKNVTSIGELAFSKCTSLAAINVDSQNENYCSSGGVLFDKNKTRLMCCPSALNATSYNIPSTVKTLDRFAFFCCEALTSIAIPDGILTIGDNAFCGCKSLTSIEIPSGVKIIEYSTFEACEDLFSISLPEGLEEIGTSAFNGCLSLYSITIPDSVTYVGEQAFKKCTLLGNISVSSGNTSYSSLNGVLFNKDQTKLIAYPGGKSGSSYIIPDTVITINGYAFDNRKLKNVTIPNSITSIYNNAFEDSITLDAIIIPDSVTYLGDNAFKNCTELTTVALGNGIDEINNNTFSGCSKLKSISIPKSIRYIDKGAFEECSEIKYVYYSSTKEAWDDISIYDKNDSLLSAQFFYDSSERAVYTSVLSVPDSILFSLWNRKALMECDHFGLETSKANHVIVNAQVLCNGNTTSNGTGYFSILNENLTDDITFSAPNFYDYIIPSAVISSWKANYIKEHSVYMTKEIKDGKTYISSVFIRKSGNEENKYIDVSTEKHVLLEGDINDVIITAVEQNSAVKEYYLSQNENHKISDIDGIFSSVDLYSVFNEDDPVYAYAVLENGQTTEPFPISLKKTITSEKAKNFLASLGSGTYNVFGKDGLKMSFSDDLPIVGGANFSTGMEMIPVGIEIENNRVRISLGIDLFKNDINGKDDTEWVDFKSDCNKTQETVEKTFKKRELIDNYKKSKVPDQIIEESKKKATVEGSLLGYIEAYIVGGEIVFKEISGTLAVELYLKHNQQFLIYGIPAIYAYVKAGIEGSVGLTNGRAISDENIPFELDWDLGLTPSVKIGGGLGVKDAVSAGVWGKSELPTNYSSKDRHLTVDITGEMGLEAEYFMLTGDVTLIDGTYNLVDHYFGTSVNSVSVMSAPLYSSNTIDVFRNGEVSLADRSYLENTSAWLGGATQQNYRRAIAPEAVTVSDLQTSVYKNSQTQLVQFGDTMMMVWIEDSADRDAYNRMRLMYSVYDTATGTWAEPQAVADNGKCDAAPSLATDGKNVYVAWQNIDYTVETADNDTVDLLMNNAEICIAEYNAQTGAFENATTITDNATYDYAPKVTVNNGVAEVYWVNSSTLDFASGSLSILKRDYSQQTNETVLSSLNYVHNIDSDGTDVSYTMDKDGDTSTTTDVKVYTNGTQVSVDYEGIDTSCLYATYAMLDGVKTLFYVDDYNLCYIQNGEEKVVFENPRAINGNLQISHNGTETTALWLEAGETGNELYTCSCENGVWTEPIKLTKFSKVLSNVATTYFNGKIYGLFNRTNLVEVTSDVDGSTYYRNGETDLCQLTTDGFNDVALSLLDIDESQFVCGEAATFSVLVSNNGTENLNNILFEITDGNGYSQAVEKEVNLASGASDFIELTYTVPETISKTELTVYASVIDDIDEYDNSICKNIGGADLSIGELNVEYVEGVYIVSGIVTNNNSVAATDVELGAYLGDEVEENLFPSVLGTIEAHESRKIEFLINQSLLDFETSSAYDVKFIVSSSEAECADYNNKSVTVIEKPCTHIHDFSDWITEKAVTCTEDGSRYKECSGCGEKIARTITATGHTTVTDYSVMPTCTESGLTAGSHCSYCGEVFVAQEVVPALGHNFVDGVCANCAGHVFDYEFVNNTIKITDCHVPSETIIIPSEIQGYRVTEIGENAFADCSTLTSISLPDGLISIGEGAFGNCLSLTSIEIPNTVTNIGGYAFYGCSSLGSVIIPDDVTSIGESAFYGCTSLNSVQIPDSVECIGDYAFYGCEYLQSITIPDSVTSIGMAAFYNCYALSSITIPNGVTSIGDETFYMCRSLQTISIPDSLTSIGDNAFYYCGNLNSVTLPDSLTTLGDGAFQYCMALKSVNIPTRLTEIGMMTFAYCYALEIVEIPDNITSISLYAFNYCTNLTSITIPSSVISIGARAFNYCSNLVVTAPCDSYAASYASTNNIVLNVVHSEIAIDEAVAPTPSDFGMTEGGHCSACGCVVTEQKPIRPLGYTVNMDGTKIFAGYDDTLEFNPAGDVIIYQWYATNNETGDSSVAISGATQNAFSPMDYFGENGEQNKYKYFYCIADVTTNGVKLQTTSPMCLNAFAFVDITECTAVDYENAVIYTDSINNVNTYADILAVESVDGLIATVTPSYQYNSVKFYGTGSTLNLKGSGEGKTTFNIVVYGDINGDGAIDVIDGAQVAQVSTGKSTLDGIYNTAGDINGDGLVDVSDYQATINKALM